MMKWYLLFTFLVFTCLINLHSQTGTDEFAYYCPPCGSDCDQIKHENPGTCVTCGMRLLQQTEAQHDMALKVRDMTIGFYLQDGVEVLDFAGPMEVFSYAGFKVITISKNKEPIKSQGILTILPDYGIDDAPKLDILATFGGNSARAFDDDKLIEWVKNQVVDYHFSVCTGAFLFSKAGILDGLTATTFHSAIDDLRKISPNTKVLDNVRYVDNGKVITTAGISAGIDGALHLVHKLLGPTAAQRIAENMEYDYWKPGGGLIIDEGH